MKELFILLTGISLIASCTNPEKKRDTTQGSPKRYIGFPCNN
jgi:hypothetical protein